MPNLNMSAPDNRAPPCRIIRTILGWLLTVLALIFWPGCFLLSGLLHAERSGVGLSAWTFDEPLHDFALHQVLVFIGPWGSLFLAAVGDALRRTR